MAPRGWMVKKGTSSKRVSVFRNIFFYYGMCNWCKMMTHNEMGGRVLLYMKGWEEKKMTDLDHARRENKDKKLKKILLLLQSPEEFFMNRN